VIRRKQQGQQAGDQAQQIQVAGDYIAGITEERAREIAQVEARLALADLTDEARSEAESRSRAFEDRALPALVDENLLGAFADPAFQIFLRKVQEKAASTTSPDDHDLLSRLLTERARKDSSQIRLAIGRAVEIVDQLDPEALRVLTVMWVVPSLCGVAGTLDQITTPLEEILAPVAGSETGDLSDAWLDDLEVLDCIRMYNGTTVTKAGEILRNKVPGPFGPGFDPDELAAELHAIQPPGSDVRYSMMVDHPLIDGKKVLPFADSKSLQAWIDEKELGETGGQLLEASKTLKLEGKSAAASAALPAYLEKNRPSLAKAHKFWDSLPVGNTLTSVGRALAYSNAKRWHALNGLPALDEFLKVR
jgi:hypothetical protein